MCQHYVFSHVFQVCINTVMMMLVVAIGDVQPSPAFEPVIVALIVIGIGLIFGHNAGSPLNPARDFAPRLFSWLAGWPKEVIS